MGLLKNKHEKHSKPTFKGILTAILATIAAMFLLLLAGLSLAGTALAFIATMPLFVVFSPVLVPAGITTGLLAMGLAASGGSGLTALSIISWLYKWEKTRLSNTQLSPKSIRWLGFPAPPPDPKKEP